MFSLQFIQMYGQLLSIRMDRKMTKYMKMDIDMDKIGQKWQISQSIYNKHKQFQTHGGDKIKELKLSKIEVGVNINHMGKNRTLHCPTMVEVWRPLRFFRTMSISSLDYCKNREIVVFQCKWVAAKCQWICTNNNLHLYHICIFKPTIKNILKINNMHI
jgi:hypothetical protein